jgi:DNA polymerase-1
MSNLIQGGVAEMMRVAISRLFPMVSDLNGHMLLQVHDQILFEIPDEMVKVAMPMIHEVMEDFPFDPKMRVDISYGKSWGNLVEEGET